MLTFIMDLEAAPAPWKAPGAPRVPVAAASPFARVAWAALARRVFVAEFDVAPLKPGSAGVAAAPAEGPSTLPARPVFVVDWTAYGEERNP